MSQNVTFAAPEQPIGYRCVTHSHRIRSQTDHSVAVRGMEIQSGVPLSCAQRH
ncbi:MAG TPA: hypothetical protein VFE65_16470 [Pseudonocardia sp.]|jgi:hypothetical protein|nr:hypothetical protein [Pseudonocardia sp.]